MGRPPIVNREEAKKMIAQGKTNADIANYYKVSHQAITPIRKEVEGEKGATVTLLHKEREIKPKRENYTFTDIQQAILQTFQQAQRAEELADENWRLRNRVAVLETALAEERKKTQSINEYELMVKRGQIPAPLIVKGDRKKLTGQ